MKKSRLLGAMGAVLLTIMQPGTVHAITIQLAFEAHNFGAGLISGTNPPENPVIGSILYEAASTTSSIDSITAIDLTIDNYSYSDGEVAAVSTGDTLVFQCITTIPGSLCGIGGSGRDFVIQWNQNTLLPSLFSYSVLGSGDYWSTTEFADFSITAVPLPPALVLFATGLLGLLATSARHRTA